jgi:CRISPR-associated protein Cas2
MHGVTPPEAGMLTLLVYDISKDRTRTKIAKRCLDFGLYRVQKSVFAGDLENNRIEEIVLASRELLNAETDSVYVFTLSKEDFERVRVVGVDFDRKLVADEVRTKVI